MKTEWRLFAIVAAFLLLIAIVYSVWNEIFFHHYDWVGTVALLLSCLLCTMLAGFFWFVSRRIDPRPEDRADAEIAEGAGEIGFFSPGSYWPFGIALSATIAGLGLAFWQFWLIGVGLALTTVASAAMLFEYYSGTRRTAEH
ncbi:Cytochrome c oxidase subunit IV [Micromonospora pattaloongensis]|uniref:Cytochrome c oxidase polypeptide 4 n=1 Tax=Micromonospora pattaloongensis TaxID=405436 RepID=A0A1H3PY03_9ACTN|nr:cytochrome c oxidase subunit 4 [Micromonospora pattaloongensis]SDZ05818.1 Cytochrome c oxidase subunit IV [Micromonospora pattaloongensis]